MSTFMAKPSNIERQWYVIDAQGLTLGRLASQVAMMLRGKTKPTFTPHMDTGDYVIVVNASQIKLTGRKLDQKIYGYHTGYAGGRKEVPYRRLMETKPEFVLQHAVRGMLPKGPLGTAMFKKLHVYAGPDHEQQAQKPVAFEIKK